MPNLQLYPIIVCLTFTALHVVSSQTYPMPHQTVDQNARIARLRCSVPHAKDLFNRGSVYELAIVRKKRYDHNVYRSLTVTRMVDSVNVNSPSRGEGLGLSGKVDFTGSFKNKTPLLSVLLPYTEADTSDIFTCIITYSDAAGVLQNYTETLDLPELQDCDLKEDAKVKAQIICVVRITTTWEHHDKQSEQVELSRAHVDQNGRLITSHHDFFVSMGDRNLSSTDVILATRQNKIGDKNVTLTVFVRRHEFHPDFQYNCYVYSKFCLVDNEVHCFCKMPEGESEGESWHVPGFYIVLAVLIIFLALSLFFVYMCFKYKDVRQRILKHCSGKSSRHITTNHPSVEYSDTKTSESVVIPIPHSETYVQEGPISNSFHITTNTQTDSSNACFCQKTTVVQTDSVQRNSQTTETQTDVSYNTTDTQTDFSKAFSSQNIAITQTDLSYITTDTQTDSFHVNSSQETTDSQTDILYNTTDTQTDISYNTTDTQTDTSNTTGTQTDYFQTSSSQKTIHTQTEIVFNTTSTQTDYSQKTIHTQTEIVFNTTSTQTDYSQKNIHTQTEIVFNTTSTQTDYAQKNIHTQTEIVFNTASTQTETYPNMIDDEEDVCSENSKSEKASAASDPVAQKAKVPSDHDVIGKSVDAKNPPGSTVSEPTNFEPTTPVNERCPPSPTESSAASQQQALSDDIPVSPSARSRMPKVVEYVCPGCKVKIRMDENEQP